MAKRQSADKAKHSGAGKGISEREVEDVEEMSSPRTPVIYEVVRTLGDEEMERPTTSLWWSGIAAGLSISFSLLAQAILETHLPDAPWRPLVAGFGYSGRLPDGGARTPAIVHREHDHGGAAGAQVAQLGRTCGGWHGYGQSCSPPI